MCSASWTEMAAPGVEPKPEGKHLSIQRCITEQCDDSRSIQTLVAP